MTKTAPSGYTSATHSATQNTPPSATSDSSAKKTPPIWITASKAVEISAFEIFDTWNTGIAPEFQALNYAPTLASALDESKQQLKPLFLVRNGKLERRIQIENRRDTNTTDDFWFWKTALDCYCSGKWVYPEPMM